MINAAKISFRCLSLCMVLLLWGCAKSILDNDDARCPFADRGGCQSMEMVNQMVREKRYTPDGQFVEQAKGSAVYFTAKQEVKNQRSTWGVK